MIKDMLVIFICVSNLTNGIDIFPDTSDYDDLHHMRRLTSLTTRTSNSKTQIVRVDGQHRLYVGFANNPFGASKLQDTSKLNMSTIFFPKTIDTTKDYSRDKIAEEGRSKRGVIHLYNMVSCATGCDPLIYKGYGCYCGFLGSGYETDGIDRCCKMHDWCYEATRCPVFLEYFMPYYWMCYKNKPICAVIHGEHGGRRSCSGQLCECDKKLSECLSRFPCPRSRTLCTSSPLRLLQNAFMII